MVKSVELAAVGTEGDWAVQKQECLVRKVEDLEWEIGRTRVRWRRDNEGTEE